MIEWLEQLRADLAAEFGTRPKVVTLATLDEDGKPRARNVVVRAVTDAGALVVASDARAGKNRQIRRCPAVEVCAWLAQTRRQYRLGCHAGIVGESESFAPPAAADQQGLREQVWREMSDAARALFFWPAPGSSKVADPTAFPEAVRTGLPPTNFELLYLLPSEVDMLDLGAHPHLRRRWDHDGVGWRVRELNP